MFFFSGINKIIKKIYILIQSVDLKKVCWSIVLGKWDAPRNSSKLGERGVPVHVHQLGWSPGRVGSLHRTQSMCLLHEVLMEDSTTQRMLSGNRILPKQSIVKKYKIINIFIWILGQFNHGFNCETNSSSILCKIRGVIWGRQFLPWRMAIFQNVSIIKG